MRPSFRLVLAACFVSTAAPVVAADAPPPVVAPVATVDAVRSAMHPVAVPRTLVDPADEPADDRAAGDDRVPDGARRDGSFAPLKPRRDFAGWTKVALDVAVVAACIKANCADTLDPRARAELRRQQAASEP